MTQNFLMNVFSAVFTPRVDVCLIRSKANARLVRRKNFAAGKNTGSPTAAAARRVKVVMKKNNNKKEQQQDGKHRKKEIFRSFSSFPPEKSHTHTHAQSLSESIFPPLWLGFLFVTWLSRLPRRYADDVQAAHSTQQQWDIRDPWACDVQWLLFALAFSERQRIPRAPRVAEVYGKIAKLCGDLFSIYLDCVIFIRLRIPRMIS